MSVASFALLLVALVILTPLIRIVIAALFARSIGQAALERQPDTIHLTPAEPNQLRHAGRIQASASEYLRQGFESAGIYAVPEMPGVSLQLLVNTTESMAAVIYDHPVVGVFYDVVSRYTDDSVWTYTTARATGIKRCPNHRTVNLPGAEPTALIAASRRERPQQGLLPCGTSTAVQDFETAYAGYMAWIKQRGLSTGEVVEVARRRVA